jgi:ribonuclease HI
MGLKIAHSRSIQALTVIGDSEIVIRELLGLSTTATQPSSGLRTQINSLKHLFPRIHYFHILRSQNTEADRLAKSTKSLEQGQLFINQISSHAWLP